MLTWNELVDKFENLVKFAARSTFEQTNNTSHYSPEDLYQEGMLLMYQCFERYKDRDLEEFGYIFKVSMWRKLRELANKRQLSAINLDDIDEESGDYYTPKVFDNVEDTLQMESMLQQAAEELSDKPVELTILKEFVNPSERTIWEATQRYNEQQKARKAGKIKYAYNELAITPIDIKNAIEGISDTQFNKSLKIVRKILRAILDEEQKLLKVV